LGLREVFMSAGLRRLRNLLLTPEWGGLGVLVVFTLAAVLGYGTFALNPALIPDSDFARNFYGLSFRLFARAHIVLGTGILFLVLFLRSRVRWVPAFVAIFLVSFLSEHLGTGYGFPFGHYEYTGLLGFKLGGRVPFLIPVSWFLMALPSWALANAVFPQGGGRWMRILLGAYLLTVWDLALDPAMSFLTPYWIWETTGPFYGMPWVNLAGWMGTGVVLMALLEWLEARSWTRNISLPWLGAYYAVTFLMPLGMVAAAGLWAAVAVSLAALLPPGLLYLFRRKAEGGIPTTLAPEAEHQNP
jgi:uncharacterized membrane protein